MSSVHLSIQDACGGHSQGMQVSAKRDQMLQLSCSLGDRLGLRGLSSQ